MVELSAEQSDEKLRSTFFRSIMFVTSASALILAGSEGAFFPAGITPIVAVVAWIFVDHYRILHIPVLVGNLLASQRCGWRPTNSLVERCFESCSPEHTLSCTCHGSCFSCQNLIGNTGG